MKCVPIRPFVVAPQIAKLAASNQNTRVRAAVSARVIATAAPLPVRGARGGPGSAAVAP